MLPEDRAKMDHGQIWDDYVVQHREGRATPDIKYAGDHWGTEPEWNQFFNKMILTHIPVTATRIVEIGQGSGKYTEKILNSYPDAKTICFDVSQEFLNVTKDRLKSFADSGRLEIVKLDADYKTMLNYLKADGQEIDCICSFDAMVHVDMQYLIAYFLTASEVLKIGGKLCMTFADVTSDIGFKHLISDLPHVYKFEGKVCMQFRWSSRDAIQSVLERLGFEVQFLDPIGGDLEVVATLMKRKNIEW